MPARRFAALLALVLAAAGLTLGAAHVLAPALPPGSAGAVLPLVALLALAARALFWRRG